MREQHTNDGDIVAGSLELPEGNVDGDTTLTLGLELVKDPGVLEGTLTELSGFLLLNRLASDVNHVMMRAKRVSCFCVQGSGLCPTSPERRGKCPTKKKLRSDRKNFVTRETRAQSVSRGREFDGEFDVG